MSDFIYDQTTGKCIAYVDGAEVFRDRDGAKIAEIRAGNLYDLDGNLVGHLQNLHVVGLRTAEIPVSFQKLL